MNDDAKVQDGDQEQVDTADDVALKIAEAATEEQKPALEWRMLVLATDGNTVQVRKFTMGLLEAKQALEMSLVSVNKEINAKAQAAAKLPGKVAVEA